MLPAPLAFLEWVLQEGAPCPPLTPGCLELIIGPLPYPMSLPSSPLDDPDMLPESAERHPDNLPPNYTQNKSVHARALCHPLPHPHVLPQYQVVGPITVCGG